MDKILLTRPENVKLVVGDVILETNRFNKKEYNLYQITKIFDDGGCELLVVKSTMGFREGRTVTGVLKCFYGGKNTRYLNYFLPAGRILYGKAEERQT